MAERHAGVLREIPRAQREDFQLVLGEGGYGIVYQSIWRDRGEVAVKKVMPNNPNFVTEVNFLHRSRHPNIIQLLGIAACDRFDYILMEFAEGGSFHRLLHDNSTTLLINECIKWAHQIAKGLAHLHAMTPYPLVHRDIKPDNLILKNENRDIKICDFGTVVELREEMEETISTARYMAPEVFAEATTYYEKSDVYSWAITVWEIFARQKPYSNRLSPIQAVYCAYKGERPTFGESCPESIQSLVSKCWLPKPAQRPTMQEVVHEVEIIIARL